MKIPAKTIASILICILWSIATLAQDQQARFDTLRAEGYEALYNLDYETARARFQKMIDLAPDHPAGPQCMASSLWVQQLNQSWELKSTLYSANAITDSKSQVDRKQADEFRKWIRRAKQLSQARLRKNARDVEALYFLGAAEGLGRRPRPVGRELEEGGGSGERALPEVELRLEHLSGEPAPLPAREVGVLDRQLRQWRREPLAEGAVERGRLADPRGGSCATRPLILPRRGHTLVSNDQGERDTLRLGPDRGVEERGHPARGCAARH